MKFLRLLVISFAFPSIGEASTIAPVTCTQPDTSFHRFLRSFGEDKKFQRTRLLIPLVARYGEYSVNGAQIEVLDQPEINNLPYPLFRSAKERASDGIYQDIVLLSKRYAEVFHGQREADSDRVLYKFRNIDHCWFLEEFHDKAL